MTSEELYRLPVDVRYQGKVCMRLFNDRNPHGKLSYYVDDKILEAA